MDGETANNSKLTVLCSARVYNNNTETRVQRKGPALLSQTDMTKTKYLPLPQEWFPCVVAWAGFVVVPLATVTSSVGAKFIL